MNNTKIYGLIIAAGLSGRMDKFKPLLEYEGKSFLQNIALKLDRVCSNTLIVTGHNADQIEENISQINLQHECKLIFNPDFKEGMFTSLQKGLRNIGECDWVLYHFVDQPTLPESFYSEFVEQIENSYDWVQPRYNGRNGHPIIINKSIFNSIISAPKTSNLREVINEKIIKKKFWECGYSQIFDDVDTSDDYEELIKQ